MPALYRGRYFRRRTEEIEMITTDIPITNDEVRNLHRITRSRQSDAGERFRAVLVPASAGWPQPKRVSVDEYNDALDTILDFFGGRQ